MKIGIVFHRDPFASPAGIDIVRLRALASGFRKRGLDAEIVAPVAHEGMLMETMPVRPLAFLRRHGYFSVVKTCYHFSIELIGDYKGPVISRIVRVVDPALPERDEPRRERLLSCQTEILRRSNLLIVNNGENERRWAKLYGPRPPIVLIPTGCPIDLPPCGENPFHSCKRPVLFLGSLASPHMVRMMNELARRLPPDASIYWIGADKMHLYGLTCDKGISPLIISCGELPEDAIWDHVRHARLGLAFAVNNHPFDNDSSKVYNYLRGGLPVLLERPVLQEDLVIKTGCGAAFAYGDIDEMVAKALQLLDAPLREEREAAIRFMLERHTWEQRVDAYMPLIQQMAAGHW